MYFTGYVMFVGEDVMNTPASTLQQFLTSPLLYKDRLLFNNRKIMKRELR